MRVLELHEMNLIVDALKIKIDINKTLILRMGRTAKRLRESAYRISAIETESIQLDNLRLEILNAGSITISK